MKFRFIFFFTLFILGNSILPILEHDDPRVLDSLEAEEKIKQENAKNENKQTPDKVEQLRVKLNFQKRSKNYLLFYDFSGTPVYVRFMRHRWDFENEELEKYFVRGNTYFITLQNPETIEIAPKVASLKGQEFDTNEVAETIDNRSIRKTRKGVLAELLYFETATIDELRY